MLNREQNDMVTRTDRGTPGGDLLRRYWQPVALSRELSDETPLPVDVMGEELVLFRDEKGAPQLSGGPVRTARSISATEEWRTAGFVASITAGFCPAPGGAWSSRASRTAAPSNPRFATRPIRAAMSAE